MSNSVNELADPRELGFTIGNSFFAAQAWGRENDFPVLALHGWLDNSASFFSLAPKLKNVYVIAIDMAGHGKSSHRKNYAAYSVWEDIAEIFAIATQLGWQKFALLGHSRGGIIATLAAGTFPERISHLGLIEGFIPEPFRIEDTPKQLAFSITGLEAQLLKSRSLYPDIATAIVARERGMFPLSHAAAKAVTERGLIHTDGGYHWNTDPRLLAPSAIKLLPGQIAAFVAQITAKTQLILGEDGLLKQYPAYKTEFEKYPDIPAVTLPGTHHLHMESSVDNVAKVLNDFFKN